MTHHTFAAVVAATGAVLGLAGPSAAAPAPLGQHVSSCAQVSLGQRESPPTVACVHDGMVMSFPTFGAMVQHMREMHGG